jgi:hypothetical protein
LRRLGRHNSECHGRRADARRSIDVRRRCLTRPELWICQPGAIQPPEGRSPAAPQPRRAAPPLPPQCRCRRGAVADTAPPPCRSAAVAVAALSPEPRSTAPRRTPADTGPRRPRPTPQPVPSMGARVRMVNTDRPRLESVSLSDVTDGAIPWNVEPRIAGLLERPSRTPARTNRWRGAPFVIGARVISCSHPGGGRPYRRCGRLVNCGCPGACRRGAWGGQRCVQRWWWCRCCGRICASLRAVR